MSQQPIWPGSGSAVSGSTPFGLYDTDTTFQTDAPKFAKWCAKRLGYPITAVELQDTQFYTCLEESVSEYSAQVNQFNIKDNLSVKPKFESDLFSTDGDIGLKVLVEL